MYQLFIFAMLLALLDPGQRILPILPLVVERTARAAWHALGLRDYGRVLSERRSVVGVDHRHFRARDGAIRIVTERILAFDRSEAGA